MPRPAARPSRRRRTTTSACSSPNKVLVEEGTGRILGAHLLGPNATEVINLFATAIRVGIPGHELKQVIFAYPSSGSDIRFML